MEPELIKELSEEQISEGHTELLNFLRELVDESRSYMSSNYYSQWDTNYDVYRGERAPDVSDKKARSRGEPVKMVVPLTRSQIDTFVAFLYTLYTQRDAFFETVASGIEDEAASKIAESVLQRDLDKNTFTGDKLIQMLTDAGIYNLGVLKDGWTEEYASGDGTLVQNENGEYVEQKELIYAGTKLRTISPYKFFPDVRLPITRFQEGEYCASDDEYSYYQLSAMQADGMIAGLEHVPDMTNAGISTRRLSFSFDDYSRQSHARTSSSHSKPPYVLTEVQVRLIPKEWDFLPDDSENCEQYVIWIANDARIVRAEPMGYGHKEFTYSALSLIADHKQFIGQSIADTIDKLQDAVTWFINARINSVRKVVQNLLVVDPSAIEMTDLQKRNPVLRIKSSKQGLGVDRWIKQLNVNDVTTSNIQDAQILKGFAQETTGLTDNLMGQYNARGKSSATEARAANSNAVARIKMLANSAWQTTFRPLGRRMLANARQGMQEEQLVQIVGEINSQLEAFGIQQFMKVSSQNMEGTYDFVIYDGSLPSEKEFTANSLLEFMQMAMSNPTLAPQLGVDLRKVATEYFKLRGVTNVERFFTYISQQLVAAPTAQGAGGVAGAPNNQALPSPAGAGAVPGGNGGNGVLASLAAGLSTA